MKPIYKKLLKELEKGNAVLLCVRIAFNFSRIRLVTPNDCEYMNLDSNEEYFERSCFVCDGVYLTPLNIVNEMIAYNRFLEVTSIKMQVLK